MVKSILLPVVLASSALLASVFQLLTPNDADSSKKAETATLIVRTEDKKTNQIVVSAEVTVRWGDFNDEHLSRHNSTLETGLATFARIPRGKVRIQVVKHDFETFTCLYTIKKAEEAIWIQLDIKPDAMKECVAQPSIPVSPPPGANTSPPHI
jgi:hypothetical protein